MKSALTGLLGLLLFAAPGGEMKDVPLPKPPVSPNLLFYLQRSKDSNTVVYEANVAANHTLDADKPVDVYWIRYAEDGQRKKLSALQWDKA